MGERNCGVNLDRLPIKLHYFFFYGGIGGVKPYMSVFGKGLGISATAVGLIFTITPFCALFSKPLFGYIVDFFRNIKLVIFLMVCVTSLSYFFVIFIPSIDETKWIRMKTQCESFDDSLYLFSSQVNEPCLKDRLITEVNGEVKFAPCYSNVTLVYDGKVSLEDLETNNNISSSSEPNETIRLKFTPDSNFSCACIKGNSSGFSSPKINSCFIQRDDNSVFYTYQFWVFAILSIISGAGAETVFCLSDTACYEVLGDRPDLYGKQRMWAAISWGIVTFVTGFLNNMATGDSDTVDYSPGFYLMLAMVSVDVVLLLKITLTKANLSLDICQDIGKIFRSFETVVFACSAYIIGVFTGLLWNYELWFLEDLGATQTLIGLCLAVQNLVAEVPFFFFSGWLLKVFGHFYCVIFTFATFALRFGLYYVLQDPWLSLPIELLHGITFGLYFATMTSYSTDKAPPGTEATTMGILAGLYEGLGVATGSLLGGIGFDNLGGRQTFSIAGIISLLSAVALFLALYIIKKRARKNETLCENYSVL